MKTLLILCLFALGLSSFAVQAQTCKDSITASTPDSRFVVNGQEVTDTQTGLIWQKCSLGQSGSDCSTGSNLRYTWSEALQAAVVERQLTGKSWRLPNIKELRSIVEEQCDNPAINLTIFPIVNVTEYPSSVLKHWSASLTDSSFRPARVVDFRDGVTVSEPLRSTKLVRLVRTGQ